MAALRVPDVRAIPELEVKTTESVVAPSTYAARVVVSVGEPDLTIEICPASYLLEIPPMAEAFY